MRYRFEDPYVQQRIQRGTRDHLAVVVALIDRYQHLGTHLAALHRRVLNNPLAPAPDFGAAYHPEELRKALGALTDTVQAAHLDFVNDQRAKGHA
jgi:hypothetical protein